jgi:7-keto-8-aminopelargonate synthetase-like enzyme
MLTTLENNILDMMPNDYPRIDKHPSCPPALKAAVQRLLLG